MSKLIAGVDEVGRGPLVGAVVTAAVILPEDYDLPGLTDSKKLSEKRRETLFDAIKAQAICWALGRAEPEEIDQLNILHASLLAMKRAVEALSIKPDHVLIDGHRCPELGHICTAEAIVKGDLTEPVISAASILAKVARDREMLALHAQFPEYGFDKHKGYPTRDHLSRLQEYGVLPAYRKSFSPVRKLIEKLP